MASSAIKTPAFQAKAGNIQNEDGSSIYSNGDWSLKNSSAVASVTIKDDGAVTLGPSGFTGNHVVNGKVGIGTSSPTSPLTIDKSYAFGARNVALEIRDVSGTTGNTYFSPIEAYFIMSTGGYYYGGGQYQLENGKTGMSSILMESSGDILFYNTSGQTANSLVSPSERMRIESNGIVKIRSNTLEVGQNTTSSYSGVFVNGIVQTYRATNAGGVGVIVANSDYYGTSSNIFVVRSEGAIYARFTSITSLSDVRFKEDVKPLTGCLSKIMKLKPSSWKWKDDRKQETTGFIAQEIEEVFPQFVTELEESEQGIEKPKAVGAAGNEMIANLVAAIQEQQAMIEELKAKVSALEAK